MIGKLGAMRIGIAVLLMGASAACAPVATADAADGGVRRVFAQVRGIT